MKRPKQPKRRQMFVNVSEHDYARFLTISEDAGVSPCRWHDDLSYEQPLFYTETFRLLLDAFCVDRPIPAHIRQRAAEWFNR